MSKWSITNQTHPTPVSYKVRCNGHLICVTFFNDLVVKCNSEFSCYSFPHLLDKVVVASSGEEVLFTDMDPEAEMDIKVNFKT